MTIVEIVEPNKELVALELGLDRIGALELRKEAQIESWCGFDGLNLSHWSWLGEEPSELKSSSLNQDVAMD